MKRITLILGITLINLLGTTQDLPESNKKVLDYVDEHYGEKVGSGLCFDLIDKALRTIDKRWEKNNHGKYGKLISIEDALPGDIIKFSGCIFANGTRAMSHVGVVYELKDGKMDVAEQNSGQEGDETDRKKRNGAVVSIYSDSQVEINTIDPKTLVKGKILIYRPY